MDVIYTDFVKAFDRVPHQRLLQKIKGTGIIGDIVNWIRSFLSNSVCGLNRIFHHGHL